MRSFSNIINNFFYIKSFNVCSLLKFVNLTPGNKLYRFVNECSGLKTRFSLVLLKSFEIFNFNIFTYLILPLYEGISQC